MLRRISFRTNAPNLRQVRRQVASVLEGDVEFWVGQDLLLTPTGGFVFVPAGTPAYLSEPRQQHGPLAAGRFAWRAGALFKEFSEKLAGVSSPDERRVLGEILEKYDTVMAKD